MESIERTLFLLAAILASAISQDVNNVNSYEMASIRGDVNIAVEESNDQYFNNQMWNSWRITSQPYEFNPYQVNQYVPSTDYNQEMGYDGYPQTTTRRPFYPQSSYYSSENPYYGHEQNEIGSYTQNEHNGYFPDQEYYTTERPLVPNEKYDESYTPSYQSTPSKPVYNRPHYKVTTRRPYETSTKNYQHRPQMYPSSTTQSPRPHNVDYPISYSTTTKPSSTTRCPYHSASYETTPPQQTYEKPLVENKYPEAAQHSPYQPKPPKYNLVPERVPPPRPALRPVYHRRPKPIQTVYRIHPRMQG